MEPELTFTIDRPGVRVLRNALEAHHAQWTGQGGSDYGQRLLALIDLFNRAGLELNFQSDQAEGGD
ncbi:MAG: hypothetical protein ERJ67_07395 [Aphanocapsa feldmannii 277cV]|uniref:Uncharacterized protein n=2 Tax=Aphanocapsa feldmannii TaxID=192050 RepID=A0A524RMG4_9CHRO|nr:MAG: hypothetical protein ERJ69_06755 [Aphanocapsa feldmannii 288cV]TGG91823.1 MAG: hypothetical protein ERJ67_07395 [Aphanocapsa feldmannii 277cV]TGH20518.1 MAG: hypothetical protein ERJ68_06765 [Aphanocapsa feldmannii 277cI]